MARARTSGSRLDLDRDRRGGDGGTAFDPGRRALSVPLIVLLIAPLAGAVFAPAFAEVPVQRRVLVGICTVAALGGAAYGLQRSIAKPPVAWREFSLDPWRAFLVCAALLPAAAGASITDRPAPRGRPGSSGSAAFAQAATLAAAAAMILPFLVTTTHLLALSLVAGTLGFAVASYVSAVDGSSSLRAARRVAALAVSDLLALVALGTTLSHGTELPPRLGRGAAWLLLTAAVLRLGIAPRAGSAADASNSRVGALWRGPVRAQGFLLAVMAIGAGRAIGYGLAAAGSLAVILALAPAFDGDAEGAFGDVVSGVAIGVAAVGFGIGGATATWGATIAVAAGFAASTAAMAPGAWPDAARASMAAAPAGGLIGGAALILSSAISAGTARPGYLAFALPVLAGLLASSAFVWRQTLRRGSAERGDVSGPLAGAIGAAVGLTLAAVPGQAASGLGLPIAASIGTGRLLSVGGEPGVAQGLAILAFAAAAIAFVAGPGVRGSGGPSRRAGGRSGTARRRPAPFARLAAVLSTPRSRSAIAAERAATHGRRFNLVSATLFAISLGLALRIFVVAAGRGFL